MSNQPKNILVFGATGLIGGHITNALTKAKSSFKKIGLFDPKSSLERKKTIFDTYASRGAEIVAGELTNDQDILSAYQNYDTVISALGREAIPLQQNLIRLAESSGAILRLFSSEFETDIEYSEASTHEKVHQDKLAVGRYFREHTTKLEYTFLVTGPYPDYYFGMGPVPDMPEIGSFDASGKKAWVLEPVEQKIAWTAMDDVGRCVVAALLRPDVGRNKALKVKSFVASHGDILREFERQTGGEWEVGYTWLEELAKMEQRGWEEGKWWKATASLRRLWMRGETLYEEGWDNEALGVMEIRSLENVVRVAVETANTK